MERINTDKIKAEVLRLRKTGGYIRTDIVYLSQGDKAVVTVRHAMRNIKKQISGINLEAYLDEYMSLDISSEINFYDWLFYKVCVEE